jgi:hypothetical protein
MPGNRVVVKFIGEDSSLKRSLTSLQAMARKSQDMFGKFGSQASTAFGKATAAAKTMMSVLAKLAIGGGALNAVHLLVGAVTQLSGAALLIPAAIGVAGAAFATFKLATSGFADAVKKGGEDLAKLSPQARETAVAIRAMKPEFDNLRKTVQDKFFTGFSDDVKKLGDTYFPLLTQRLPEIATGFNRMGHEAAVALAAPKAKNSIDQVLKSTAGLLAGMPHALANVTSGFLTLAGAGAKRLTPLGSIIEKLSDKFNHWADGFVSSGGFDKAVDSAIAGFKNLWDIGKNVVDIVREVWAGLSAGQTIADVLAGGSANGGPLVFFKDMTAALKDFFAESKSKDALVALGQALSDVAGAAGGAFLAFLREIRPVIVALQPTISRVAQAVGKLLVNAFHDLGPPITRFIKEYGPTFANAVEHIAGFIKDKVIPALGIFIDWLTNNKQGIKDFFLGLVDAAIFAGKVVLGTFVAISQGLGMVFSILSLLPGSAGRNFGAMSQQAFAARDAAIKLAGGIDAIKPKNVEVTQHGAEGAKASVDNLKRAIDAIPLVKRVMIEVSQRVNSIISNPFGRAVGGTVNKGQTYLVGERGPELLTMPGSGSVTPNHKLASSGGGGGGAVTISFGGQTDGAFAAAFMKLVRTGAIQLQAG